jgi:hypothetical protein
VVANDLVLAALAVDGGADDDLAEEAEVNLLLVFLCALCALSGELS